jgi:hypothetical protein
MKPPRRLCAMKSFRAFNCRCGTSFHRLGEWLRPLGEDITDRMTPQAVPSAVRTESSRSMLCGALKTTEAFVISQVNNSTLIARR